MTRWQQVLREQDPVEPLTADDTSAIRRLVVAEAARAAATRPPAQRLFPAFALASALVVAAVAGIFVARAHPRVEMPAEAASPGELRQLQFATPGGTRIIWQFNPDFTLRETIP